MMTMINLSWFRLPTNNRHLGTGIWFLVHDYRTPMWQKSNRCEIVQMNRTAATLAANAIVTNCQCPDHVYRCDPIMIMIILIIIATTTTTDANYLNHEHQAETSQAVLMLSIMMLWR